MGNDTYHLWFSGYSPSSVVVEKHVQWDSCWHGSLMGYKGQRVPKFIRDRQVVEMLEVFVIAAQSDSYNR